MAAEEAGTRSGSGPAGGSTTDQDSVTAVIDYPEGTGITIITLAGTVDAEPMMRLVDMLAAEYVDGDVVVDMSPVMMRNPAAVRALVAHLREWADTAHLRIVCSRLTARRLLRLWGGGGLPLCASIDGALGSLRIRTGRAAEPAAAAASVG